MSRFCRRFCYDRRHSGEAMNQPVERRLAAILAADVADYSRLMGADEAGTAQAIREHRAAADPVVAHHGGRINRSSAFAAFPSVIGGPAQISYHEIPASAFPIAAP